MGEFYKVCFDYSDMSLSEGFEIWEKTEGVRTEIGYGHACLGGVTPGPHWTGRWVDTRGMGNHGKHIILPVSRPARRLVRERQVEIWSSRYDVSYRQAARLYGWRGPYKYELAEEIFAAVRDDSVHPAFRVFPGVGRGLHNPWFERWREVVKGHCRHSWNRNQSLIEASLHVLE